MVDRYSCGVYWGVRQESAAACARRAVHCLARLAACDPVLARWFERSGSRAEATRHEVDPVPAALDALVVRGANRADVGGQVLPVLGYRFGLWTGRSDDESACLSVGCGCAAPVPGINSCVLTLPAQPAVAERLLRLDPLHKIMEALASAWEPDWGVVTSPRFAPGTPPASPHEPHPGWLLYLSQRYGPLPELAAPAEVLPCAAGALIVAVAEPFVAADPAHRAAVERVAAELRQAGLLRALA